MRNVLVTSAGRRVELVKAFQHALSYLTPSEGNLVIAVDMEPDLSAACHAADRSYAVPRSTDKDYSNQLLTLAISNDVKIIIPTIDTELEILSRSRNKYKEKGVDIIISHPDLIDFCDDKRKTGLLFNELNIKYPKIYNSNDIKYPAFVKPYNGSRSVGARKLETKEDLSLDILNDPAMMFMELINSSYSEYTVDGYYDRESRLKCLVPRERIFVRDGEVNKGVTRKGQLYDQLLKKLSYVKGAVGCLTFQFFFNEDEKECIGLEINPRFGGGYPLSYSSGADFPSYIIREYILDQDVPFNSAWEKDLLMLRYDAHVLVKSYES